MVRVGERNINMIRGWIVQFHDGTVICEEDMEWRQVPNKRGIRKMLLKWEDRLWSIENKKYYLAPSKRGYIDSSGGHYSTGLDSRTIGYYDAEQKMKVIMRVDEITGTMKYEYQDYNQ